MRRLTRIVALVALLAACGDAAPTTLAPPVSATTPAPGDTRRFYKARLQMSVTGAETFVYDAETVLDVHEIAGGENPQAIWFLTVSAGERIQTAEGRVLSFSADLAPGTYAGPGTYTIDGKTQGKVLGVESNIGSAAFLLVADLRANPPTAKRYGVLVEPCTFIFAEDARNGSLTCPALGDDAGPGNDIRLTWTWERI